ncbi:MAG: hypothetical protein IJ869_05875 [Clostridiales bacterium]|nr:hypothetical protein [Clostridiales bacterium]
MPTLYNSENAKELLRSMDKYCSEIQKNARDLLALTEEKNEWDDPQSMLFRDCTIEICHGLETSLQKQSDYMSLFKTRIDELEGS